MSIATPSPRQRKKRYPVPSIRRQQEKTRSKDQFCFKHIRERRSGYVHCWLCSLRVRPSEARRLLGSDRNDRICSLFTMSDICVDHRNDRRSCFKRTRVDRGDQTFRRKPFRRNGGARRDRTDDLKLAKLALSQLSYGPERYRSSINQQAHAM